MMPDGPYGPQIQRIRTDKPLESDFYETVPMWDIIAGRPISSPVLHWLKGSTSTTVLGPRQRGFARAVPLHTALY